MLFLSKRPWLKGFATLAIALGSLVALSTTASAASVSSCSDDAQKCIIKLETGTVGDAIQVLDGKGRLVAKGVLVKRRGAYGVIQIHEVNGRIAKGFPVVVAHESRDAALEWTAAFGK